MTEATDGRPYDVEWRIGIVRNKVNEKVGQLMFPIKPTLRLGLKNIKKAPSMKEPLVVILILKLHKL